MTTGTAHRTGLARSERTRTDPNGPDRPLLRLFPRAILQTIRSRDRLVDGMWDLDPRDYHDRERHDGWDRTRGSRGDRSARRDQQGYEPRDVFVRAVDLPLDVERELVRDRERAYEIDGTDSRVLAAVGAFRVVSEGDLDRGLDGQGSARDSLRHLEDEGLVGRSSVGPGERVAFLTDRGKDLLEAHRWEREDGWRREPERQAFYAGLRKPRELSHDSRVYRAYLRAEERLRSQGGRVRRVVLDYELKRDYQKFLQEGNRGRTGSDGRPHRTPREIENWAREHDLPYTDGHVQFPDLRIEYDDRERRERHEDVEVTTEHYRGAHAAAVAGSGFTRYRSGGGLSGGRGVRGRGGSGLPRLAEELL